jgi:hypothetical protein
LENFEVYDGEIHTMVICFDYIVALIVHQHFVVKEIFLDIQVGSNSGSEIINACMKIIAKQFSHTPISGFQPTGLVPSSPLHFMTFTRHW